jgi:hypothetical protein
MKIITVNLPKSYIKAIKHLTGEDGIYPSRSELIRVAVREFLRKEMGAAEDFQGYHKPKRTVEEILKPYGPYPKKEVFLEFYNGVEK